MHSYDIYMYEPPPYQNFEIHGSFVRGSDHRAGPLWL